MQKLRMRDLSIWQPMTCQRRTGAEVADTRLIHGAGDDPPEADRGAEVADTRLIHVAGDDPPKADRGKSRVFGLWTSVHANTGRAATQAQENFRGYLTISD